MNDKKFLDQEGVKHLWSKISMEDYPNNETLIAVLNAIDQTKADKENTQNKITGNAGDFVIIGADGNVTTRTIPLAEEVAF